MNNVAYFEIQTSDPKKSAHFYEQVFGWKFVLQEGFPLEY